MNEFVELLKRAGLLKSQLADRLGLSRNAVSKWGDHPPKYAVAYLELLIEFNEKP